MKLLADFFKAIENDPRIGPSHISLYVALHQIWEKNNHDEPLLIKRTEVMEMAKIAGFSTYHRVLRDLVEQGYLNYEGRFDRKGSKIFMASHKE